MNRAEQNWPEDEVIELSDDQEPETYIEWALRVIDRALR